MYIVDMTGADVPVRLEDVPGVYRTGTQIIRSPNVARVHKLRFKAGADVANHVTETSASTVAEHLKLCKPGMPIHPQVEVRHIISDDNPCKGFYGLFTKKGGSGV